MSLKGDPILRQAIEQETQRQRFQSLVHELTGRCWETCAPDRMSARLESRTESCLVNCVDRFLDTTNFVVNRLERTAALGQSGQPGLSGFSADGDQLITE